MRKCPYLNWKKRLIQKIYLPYRVHSKNSIDHSQNRKDPLAAFARNHPRDRLNIVDIQYVQDTLPEKIQPLKIAHRPRALHAKSNSLCCFSKIRHLISCLSSCGELRAINRTDRLHREDTLISFLIPNNSYLLHLKSQTNTPPTHSPSLPHYSICVDKEKRFPNTILREDESNNISNQKPPFLSATNDITKAVGTWIYALKLLLNCDFLHWQFCDRIMHFMYLSISFLRLSCRIWSIKVLESNMHVDYVSWNLNDTTFF